MNDFDDRPPARRQAMQRLAILGVLCLLLGAVAGPVAVHRLSATMPARPAEEPAPPPVSYSRSRAVVVELHSFEADEPYEQRVEDVAAAGAKAVCFSVLAWQGNHASSSVFIEYRTYPTEERLIRLVRLAHKRGLKVMVMPVVKLGRPRPGDWAGTISPTQLHKWWEDYTNVVLFYADRAHVAGADAFAIGSQLVASEDQVWRWRWLTWKVRERFSRQLCYVADLRTYQQIPWWTELDLLAVTAAFGTGSDARPTLKSLLASRAPAGEAVVAFQGRIRRPVVYVLGGPPEAVRQAAAASRPAPDSPPATRSTPQP